jgi:polar amino acid transport system substrate-binding protein
MWLVVALIIILIPGHVLWLIDRGSEDSVCPDRKYFPGIFQALNWAATALVSQVMVLPRHWLARILGLLWMYAGVVFIALYTAQLTATLTTERIRGAINSVADLPGKRVATMAKSVPAQYLRKIGAQVQEFETTDEMFAALLDQRADAVFFNSAMLRYFATHGGTGRVRVVGPEVNRQELGFLFQLGSPLRKKVGGVLIAMREDGTYRRIYEKWFGADE